MPALAAPMAAYPGMWRWEPIEEMPTTLAPSASFTSLVNSQNGRRLLSSVRSQWLVRSLSKGLRAPTAALCTNTSTESRARARPLRSVSLRTSPCTTRASAPAASTSAAVSSAALRFCR